MGCSRARRSRGRRPATGSARARPTRGRRPGSRRRAPARRAASIGEPSGALGDRLPGEVLEEHVERELRVLEAGQVGAEADRVPAHRGGAKEGARRAPRDRPRAPRATRRAGEEWPRRPPVSPFARASVARAPRGTRAPPSGPRFASARASRGSPRSRERRTRRGWLARSRAPRRRGLPSRARRFTSSAWSAPRSAVGAPVAIHRSTIAARERLVVRGLGDRGHGRAERDRASGRRRRARAAPPIPARSGSSAPRAMSAFATWAASVPAGCAWVIAQTRASPRRAGSRALTARAMSDSIAAGSPGRRATRRCVQVTA